MSSHTSTARLRCPLCSSDSLRKSHPCTFTEALRSLIGVRTIRCLRCLHRFGAFAPRIRQLERRKEATLFQPILAQRPPQPAPAQLAEIQAMEAEWQRAIQPTTSIERVYCTQLAQATWHLRCLNQVERDTIADAVRRGSFNGESARQLMEWRRSTEQSIQRALDQIQHYRRTAAAREAGPPLPDLGLLAQALGSAGAELPMRATVGAR